MDTKAYFWWLDTWRRESAGYEYETRRQGGREKVRLHPSKKGRVRHRHPRALRSQRRNGRKRRKKNTTERRNVTYR